MVRCRFRLMDAKLGLAPHGVFANPMAAIMANAGWQIKLVAQAVNKGWPSVCGKIIRSIGVVGFTPGQRRGEHAHQAHRGKGLEAVPVVLVEYIQ